MGVFSSSEEFCQPETPSQTTLWLSQSCCWELGPYKAAWVCTTYGSDRREVQWKWDMCAACIQRFAVGCFVTLLKVRFDNISVIYGSVVRFIQAALHFDGFCS